MKIYKRIFHYVLDNPLKNQLFIPQHGNGSSITMLGYKTVQLPQVGFSTLRWCDAKSSLEVHTTRMILSQHSLTSWGTM